MKTLCRLALAALLTGAVCLPALAAGPACHASAGQDGCRQAGDKPAAMTEKVGSHAATTEATPPASAAVTPRPTDRARPGRTQCPARTGSPLRAVPQAVPGSYGSGLRTGANVMFYNDFRRRALARFLLPAARLAGPIQRRRAARRSVRKASPPARPHPGRQGLIPPGRRAPVARDGRRDHLQASGRGRNTGSGWITGPRCGRTRPI